MYKIMLIEEVDWSVLRVCCIARVGFLALHVINVHEGFNLCQLPLLVAEWLKNLATTSVEAPFSIRMPFAVQFCSAIC